VVSYGVYLWHEAWIEEYLHWTTDSLFHIPLLALVLSVTALAVASASVSYAFVERPIRLIGRHPLGVSFASARGTVHIRPRLRPTASPEPPATTPAAEPATNALAAKA
jgi:peptidoglycan/LPS O-acetylase OafA/YrhL